MADNASRMCTATQNTSKMETAASHTGGDTPKADFEWKRDTWAFVNSYLNVEDHPVAHHLDTYNRFVRHNVASVIRQSNPIRLHFAYDPVLKEHRKRVSITLRSPGFQLPSTKNSSGCMRRVTPSDCRRQKMTYASNLIVDVDIETTVITPRNVSGDPECPTPPPRVERRTTTARGLCIGRVPVMINSCLCATTLAKSNGVSATDLGECEVDPGGYFIVSGSEKVLVSVERPADNQIMVYPNMSPPAVDIKSIPSGASVRPRPFQLKIVRGPLGEDVVRVFVPNVRQNVPIWTVMRALGATTDRHINSILLLGLAPRQVNILADQLLRSSMNDSNVQNQEEAIEFLSRHVSSFGGVKQGGPQGESAIKLAGALRYAHSSAKAGPSSGPSVDLDKAELDRAKRIAYTRTIVERDILPHVGKSARKKRFFVGHMFRALAYAVFTRATDDDRDSFMNKRVNAGGALMSQLFSQSYTKVVREIKNTINKAYSKGSWTTTDSFHSIISPTNIHRYIRESILTKSMRIALSTGNFGAKGTTTLAGVSQVLNRLSFCGTVSHLRRVIAPLGNMGKLLKPRALHPTQVFCMCPAETPEGQPVGLVKNLALAAHLTVYCSPQPAIRLLQKFGCRELDKIDDTRLTSAISRTAHVYVDGDWWGITDEPLAVARHMRRARQLGDLHGHTSISWRRSLRYTSTGALLGELWICGTGGRLVRPMYILDDSGNFNASAQHVAHLKGGGCFDAMVHPSLSESTRSMAPAIEYIDIAESDTLMVAMTEDDIRASRKGVVITHTHCELHPSLMLGALAALIPHCDHNQSPRNTYQSAMGKQSMGLYATNFDKRYGTLAHMLYYPQRPLVQSRIHSALPTSRMPNGQTVIVAIATHGGYNQEDSVITNQSAVARGLMVSTMYKTYRSEERTTEGTTHRDKFCVPDASVTTGTKVGGYDKLSPSTGIALVGQIVSNGDVIIGKTTPQIGKGSRCHTIRTYRDSSTVLRNCTGGIVDRTMTATTDEGGRIARVRVRSVRDASVGDKLSSRHGQKGTIGMVRRHEDMPFTSSGMTPDIIMNPHAIPSRMTVGQLVEAVQSKICTLLGTRGDGTPFSGTSPTVMTQFIAAVGGEACGDQTLFDPITGKTLRAKIFICPTYYQKLRHIARDKAHARSTGPMVEMTRQPTEGRARDGGLRMGEMERDCLLAHGMANFTRESMLRRADDFSVGVCATCGHIAPRNPAQGISECHACVRKNRGRDDGNTPDLANDVRRVELPYAAKLLMHELGTMNISVSSKFK